MKKFFILLIVVIMLTGLTFSSFARQKGLGKGDCDQVRDPEGCVPVCTDCPNPGCPDPEGCEPIGDGPKQKKGK